MDWALPVGTAVITLYVVAAEFRLRRLGRENTPLRRALRSAGLTVGLLLGADGPAAAFPKLGVPHAYNRTPAHPDRAVVEALIFLETKVPPAEWGFWRFFHWLSTDEADLADELGNFGAYLQMLNGTAPGPVRPVQVDQAGRVWAVDRREAGWSAAAFHAVATLDNTCREPGVDPLLADELRRAVGVKPDGTRFPHCEGLVPGYWFVREVQETDRHRNDPENIAYYNLLYSRERFGDDFDPVGFVDKAATVKVDRPRDERPRQRKSGLGRQLPYDAVVDVDRLTVVDQAARSVVTLERGAGFRATNAVDAQAWVYGTTEGGRNGFVKEADLRMVRAVKDTAPAAGAGGSGFIDRNFPRDADEFDERWGVRAAFDFLRRQKIFLANGTIIAGYFNDPKNGSLVSDNDRVNQFANGPLGVAMKTSDFDATVGRKNVANFPLNVAVDDVDEEASERIYQKQDGWPAWWLNGPKRAGAKRVESGDPHIVHDRINGGTVIVQTFHKCVGCHYPSDVVLGPSNEKFIAGIKRGQELFARNSKAGALTVDRFFFDGDAVGEGWKWQLKRWREPFSRSLAAATRTPRDRVGWGGTKFAAVSNARRDWYDAPLRLGQMAAELGYSRLATAVALNLLSDFDAGQALLDDKDWPGVPRAQWDGELFGRAALVLAAARDLEIGPAYAPGFAEVFPEYARDPHTPPYRIKTLPGGSQ